MHNLKEGERLQLRAHIREHLHNMFGLKDTSGIELFTMIQILANQSETIESRGAGENEISGPRWRLMLRLLVQEQFGNQDGLTPTDLSRSQRVSKNTISALLRGLEEQGLIQRTLDPKDFRIFRIQLTEAGRNLVRSTAPRRLEGLNHMADGLSPEERDQLMMLLEKLHLSLHAMACSNKEIPDGG